MLVSVLPVLAEPAPPADVRVLIDISGSMKKSDPGNLRIPATRLLAGLMPDGSRCGVWTFGRYVNMLVPVRNVDKEWRTLARSKAAEINSAGLYTNIEGVLETATSGWFEKDPEAKRSLILLSDGYVDVSKNASESAESRRRIIENTLPRLKKAGVVVHTVALSEDADHQLLETIAVATDGSYMKADEASRLNRLFLKLFEKSAEVPSLPLTDNKFKVDSSVTNMTLVVMQGKDAKPVAINTPDGKTISQASHPAAVKWYHETGYDLVTIEAPVSGEWRIDASVDPDNRVVVATNLALDVSPLPNRILPNEAVNVFGHMLEDGKPLVKSEVLGKIEMFMVQEQHDGSAQRLQLRDDGFPPDLGVGDGVYSTALKALEIEGIYELSVIANAPTFEREYRHTLQVMGAPVETKVEALPAEEGGAYLLTLKPRLDSSVLTIRSLTLKLADSKEPAVELPRDGDEIWRFELPPQVGDKHLTFAARGVIDGGREFTYEWNMAMPAAPPLPEPIVDSQAANDATTPSTAADESIADAIGALNDSASSHADEGTVELGEESPQTPGDAVAEEEGATQHKTKWGVVIAIIVGVNLLFVACGGAWYWWTKKRQRRAENDPDFEVDGAAAKASGKESGSAPAKTNDSKSSKNNDKKTGDNAGKEAKNAAAASTDAADKLSQDKVA